MKFLVLFFYAVTCCISASKYGGRLRIKNSDDFTKALATTHQAFEAMENNSKLLYMKPEVKAAIGMQKFGPIFEAFADMPAALRAGAVERVLVCYHFFFAELPPPAVLSSLKELALKTNDKTFQETIQSTLQEMAFEGPGDVRRKRYENSADNGRIFKDEEVKVLSDLMDSFLENPEHFQNEIDLMYGSVPSYEDALKDSIKSILLIKGALVELNKVSDHLLDKLLMDREHRRPVFHRLISIQINTSLCNKMIRMLLDGLVNKNRQGVVQVFGFIEHVSQANFKGLPHLIVDKFKAFPIKGKVREFCEWKLLTKVSTMHEIPPSKEIPTCWFSHRPLLASLQSRIKLALSPFLEAEERRSNPGQFQHIGLEFQDILLVKPLPDNATTQEARRYYREMSEKDFLRIIKRYPAFADFADLNEGEMDGLLKAINNLDRDCQESSIMDFGGGGIKMKAMGQSKKAKRKRAKQAKQPEIDQSTSEPPVEKDTDEKILEHSKADLIDVDDKAKGKEEEEKEELNVPAMVEVKPNVDDVNESEAADAIAAECKLIEEELANTIEQYRILKKLRIDHSKLHRRKINFKTESSIPKHKPRIVAFFHTDDFRLIHPQANMVYVNNELNDTSGSVLNAGKSSVSLKWVFNPEVRIDYEAYQFLCQLFGLAPGRNRLTFNDFLRTFRQLNPVKARLMTRRDYSRLVFQFEHAIETEDQVFVPPIGGGHPEHLSSDFNHNKLHKFMMNGGAHPYFFQLE